MTELQAIILGFIEGITEFLPISSTGHMILADAIMNIHDRQFTKTFEIAIQFAAILAVVVIYLRKFFQSATLYFKLSVAFIPTGIIGFFLHKYVKALLFNPLSVSIALIVGGAILIILNRFIEEKESAVSGVEDISFRDAAIIGFFQSLSIIPGVSRSAATIVGGVFAGFNKEKAIEFSFLLAVPTMFVATSYDLFKSRSELQMMHLAPLLWGAASSFISAYLAIQFFLKFVNFLEFKYFGYYRIIFGGFCMALALVYR